MVVDGMFYAYALRSKKDKRLYIGHAADVTKRLEDHNSGRVRSTKHRAPFLLLYHKSFPTRSEARWQEREWKTAWGHKQLTELIDFIPR